MTPEERAEKIVGALYVPHDPRRWGESTVSVLELREQISQAVTEAATEQRERIATRWEAAHGFDKWQIAAFVRSTP